MTKEEVNKIIEENEAMVIGCTYNVLFTNDIVIGQVVEAVETIKRSPLYRMKTKQLINKVEIVRRKYERMVNEVIGGRCTFFADANDIFLEDIQKHLDVLYWSIKRVFDKHNLIHSDVISKLELARTMCEFGCAQLDKREEELQEKDKRFRKIKIDYLRQTELLKMLNEVMRTMEIPSIVNLNTEDTTRAINILSVKLASAEIIAKAISA